MSADIFAEFLEIFDKYVQRKVLLLLDNAASHLLGIKDAELNNVKILLLLPNSTAKLQPLDCGIISNLKFKYRKKLLCRFLSEEDEKNRKITVLDAINMISLCWAEVTEHTIRNCWIKSKLLNGTIEMQGVFDAKFFQSLNITEEEILQLDNDANVEDTADDDFLLEIIE